MTSKQEHSNYNGKHSREVSMIDSVLTDETPYTSTMHDDHDPNDIAGNETSKGYSSVWGATLNFTNAIIGAGAMGLGGAFAESGGIISILALLLFATLAKISNDMIIDLTLQVEQLMWLDDSMAGSASDAAALRPSNSAAAKTITYELLGEAACGLWGMYLVLLSKMVYSFGCLVAYIIVIRDNLGSGLEGAIYGLTLPHANGGDVCGDINKDMFRCFLRHDTLVALISSTVVVLPLCFFRDISPLAKFSYLSNLSMILIAAVVIHLFSIHSGDTGNHWTHYSWQRFVDDWLVVRMGIFASLGTFVFTFVAHHTVHLTFQSLHPRKRNLKQWKKVSSFSISISAAISLIIGCFVYMTYWREVTSSIFEMYPPSIEVNGAKILLCISMLLTYPLPFYTCREMTVLLLLKISDRGRDEAQESSLRESLLQEEFGSSYMPILALGDFDEDFVIVPKTRAWLLPDDNRQLTRFYHGALTIVQWGLSVGLALSAPSLGSVLDVIGCVSGTFIAFLLPGLFSLKLLGFSVKGVAILLIGAVVGLVGTVFSIRKLILETKK